MTLPAFIYARYSSQEQGRGTSLVRQFENGRKHAEKHGWLNDPDREISDKGRSAFHGANRAEGGALWEFERQTAAGFYRNGAVIITEHFDRISRQGWEEVYAFLKLCTSNGVSVATIDGDRVYEAGKEIEPTAIMEVIWKAQGSKDESKKKSDRGLFNWSEKIKAIEGGSRRVNIGQPPAWMDRDPVTKEARLIPHRVEVLNEVFQLYSDGYGLHGIVRLFNARNEPSWGIGKKNKGQGWNTAYLHKLLKNRAVLGEYEPMSRTHGGITETSKGIRQADFFPQAVSAELFNKAQAVKANRVGTGGRSEATVNNLFSGSAFCRECGGAMYYQSQQKAGRPTNHKSKLDGRKLQYLAGTDRSYLICNNGRRNHQCKNKLGFRYEKLEPAILDAVISVVLDDKRFSLTDQTAALAANVAELERQIEGKRHNLDQIVETLSEMFIKALAIKAQEIERDIEQDEERLAEMANQLRRETGAATPTEHLDRVREIRGSLDSEDKDARYGARVRVKQALSHLIRIVCGIDGIATVQVANGLMAWQFDRTGEPLGKIDLRDRLDLHHGLTSGQLASNATQVETALRRSKAI